MAVTLAAGFLFHPMALRADDKRYTCQDECLDERETITRDYRECEEQASQIEDRMAATRQKQFCRKRFPMPDCTNLAPCPKKDKAAVPSEKAQVAAEFKIANFKLASTTIAAGQSTLLSYDIVLNKPRDTKLWFDQDLVIVDAMGAEQWSDHQSYEQGAMSATYSFKTTLIIPKAFQKGTYRLKLTLKERYSSWLGQSETSFKVH